MVALPAAMPPRGTVGLSLPDDLPFDDWCALGRLLGHYERSIMWAIGDWWAFGQHRYGERAAVVKAEGWEGPGFNTCTQAARVSRRFGTCSRRQVLSWKHHQEVAALPATTADRLLDDAEAKGWSTRELRARVCQIRNAEKVEATVANDQTCTVADLNSAANAGMKFGCIYADPPWRYDNQGTRSATGNFYDGMDVDEIAALPVADLAADSAHLHLWTTNAFLFDCQRIMEAWGFEYRGMYVWVKPQLGIGNYWRVSHELMLFGKRGSAPFLDRSMTSWGMYDRTQHSAKPEEIRRLIERASPGPRLELFARRIAPGWAAWGNQIERTMFDQSVREVA